MKLLMILGGIFVLLGLPFLVRGWLYCLRPDHPISKKAQTRNIRLGLETDMKKFGRKVRRVGTLIVAIGSGFLGYGIYLMRLA